MAAAESEAARLRSLIKTDTNSSGGSGGSGRGGGGSSSKDDAERKKAEEARRKAEAQIKEMLKGNESAQAIIDLINAQKLSYESAKASGLMSDAELYHQRAEILRQELYELEARRGRDISDIINARGNDAGKWEEYTLEVAREEALKDGVIDSRETAIIHNKEEQYNIAVQTGKNGIHYDTPDSDANERWEDANYRGLLIAMNDVVSDVGGLYLKQDNNVYKTLDEYLKANYSGKMTVTILIQQPVVGERTVIDFNSNRSVGHTFIRIDMGDGNVIYRGFYPAQALNTKQIVLKKDVEGVLNTEGDALDSENYNEPRKQDRQNGQNKLECSYG